MQKSALMIRLGVLFAGFPDAKPIDPALAWEAYGRPLSSLDDWAVESAIENFQNGEVEGQDLRRGPSVAALVSEVRRLMAEKARREARDAPRLPERNPISQEERDRVGVKMAKLAADLATRLRTQQAADDLARRERRPKVDAASLGDPRPLEERLRIDELLAGA